MEFEEDVIDNHTLRTPEKPRRPVPYAQGNGNELFTFDKGGPTIQYHSVFVDADDANLSALVVTVDFDYGGPFSVAAGRKNYLFRQGLKLIEHFRESNLILRPFQAEVPQVVRLCLCPQHMFLSAAHPIDDMLLSIIPLEVEKEVGGAPKKDPQSDAIDDEGNGVWCVAVECTKDGCARFYNCHRTTVCCCLFPMIFH